MEKPQFNLRYMDITYDIPVGYLPITNVKFLASGGCLVTVSVGVDEIVIQQDLAGASFKKEHLGEYIKLLQTLHAQLEDE